MPPGTWEGSLSPQQPISHTSQRVVGVEPQSKVPDAGEELCLHLPGSGVVHALRAEGPAGEGARVRGPQSSLKTFSQNLPRTSAMISNITSGGWAMGRWCWAPGRDSGRDMSFPTYL